MSGRFLNLSLARGQALSEAIVIMPVALILTFGVAQVLWILLASVMFQYAALNAVYSGALTGFDKAEMQLEFQRKIAKLPGTGIESNDTFYPASFELLSPTQEELRAFAIPTDKGLTLELSHFHVALNELAQDKQGDLLSLRELVVEASWCFGLRVPVAGKLIAGAAGELLTRQPCLSISGLPMIRLTQTFVAPLRSDLTLS